MDYILLIVALVSFVISMSYINTHNESEQSGGRFWHRGGLWPYWEWPYYEGGRLWYR